MKRGKTILLSVLLITIILFSSKLIFSQSGPPDDCPVPPCGGNPVTVCDDGLDNDIPPDGLVDYPNDPGCFDSSDNTEFAEACSDTLDNDFPIDGLIDWPADPGCSSYYDNDEFNALGPTPDPLDESCVPQSGLVSWWRADGDAEDNENTNDGDLIAGTYAPGKYSQAFKLNIGSIGHYVNVPDSPSLDMTTGLTIAAWINPSNTATGEIVNKIGPDQTNTRLLGYNLYLQSDNLKGRIYNSMGQAQIIPAPFSFVNSWHHVVFVVSPDDLELYVDNNKVSQLRNNDYYIGTNSNSLKIGAAEGNYFEGLIDEVQIYNRDLTSQEISNLYDCQSTVCTSDADCPPDKQCVGGVCQSIIPPTSCTSNSDCPGQVCLNGDCVDDGGPTNLDCGLGYICVLDHSACFNDDTNIFKKCDPANYCTDDPTNGASCATPKKQNGHTPCNNDYECLSDNCDYEEEDDTQKTCLESEEESCSDVDGIVCDPGETCDPGEWDEDVSELRCCVGDSDPDSPKCKGGDQWIPTLGTSVRFDKTCIGTQTQVTVIESTDTTNTPTQNPDILSSLDITVNPYIDSQDYSCNTDLFQSSTTGQPVPAYGLISILTSISLIGLFYVFRNRKLLKY